MGSDPPPDAFSASPFELLNEAETFWGGEFASDNPIDGGDLVEWFAAWFPKVRHAIAVAQGQETGAVD
jgi:hypothetical protein